MLKTNVCPEAKWISSSSLIGFDQQTDVEESRVVQLRAQGASISRRVKLQWKKGIIWSGRGKILIDPQRVGNQDSKERVAEDALYINKF